MFPRGSKVGPASIGIGTTSEGSLNLGVQMAVRMDIERMMDLCEEQIEYISTQDKIRMSGCNAGNGGTSRSIIRESAKSPS